MTAVLRRTLRRRLPLLLGLTIALIVGLGPVAVLSLLTDEPPELRLRLSRTDLAAVVADGDARVAILDVSDREVARDLRGALGNTLDDDLQLLVVPASAEAAIGLLEWLQSDTPQEIVVIGVAGADANWLAVERRADERDIPLRYVSGEATVHLPRLELVIYGSAPGDPVTAAVAVRDPQAGTAVVIELGSGSRQPVTIPRTLTIARDPRQSTQLGAVLVPRDGADATHRDSAARVLLDDDTLSVVRFDGRQLRISNGDVVPAQPGSTMTATTHMP